jgi:hypothetical protein
MGGKGMGFLFMRVLHEPSDFKVGQEIVINEGEAFTNELSIVKPIRRKGPTFIRYTAPGASIWAGG